MKSIAIGSYMPGKSFIHRMDPRAKILCTIVYIVMVFLASQAWGYAILAVFFAVTVALSELPVKFFLRSMKPLVFILIFTFVANLFFITGGSVLLEFWFIKIYDEGLKTAAFMALRLLFLISGTTVMTLTTSPIQLTDAIERLLSPLKKLRFPAHEIAMMMSIALRFIPTLLEETDKIMKAQMSRGADFESGNIVRRLKSMIPLLVPLFVSAFRRAEDLAIAMESRCYRGGVGRTRLRVLRYTRIDVFAAAVMAVFIAALIVWG